MHKCPFCSYENENLDSIRIHGTKKHQKSAMELRLLMFHDNVRPKCKCGCNEETKFANIHIGFNEYIRGHHSRVKNNWGHNTKALEKSQDKRREQIADGKWIPWNKGETVLTDERIANYGKNGSATIHNTPGECVARSKRMTKNRLSGIVPTLFGKDSSQWKGGVSSVQALSRSYVYNVWTYPKLHASKFTCQRCSSHENLCVHHDGERFAEILQKAREVLGDVTEDFSSHQAYAQWIADYHVKNNVSGIVLCEKCHSKEHATLVI